MSVFVDNLEFTNIKLDEELSDKNCLKIDFTLENEFDFYLIISFGEEEDFVIRHSFNRNSYCPFCHQKGGRFSTLLCNKLTNHDHIEEIITILLNHPNVRLKRLFL